MVLVLVNVADRGEIERAEVELEFVVRNSFAQN